ncbi:hypothetical protein WA026_000132 [Henosepilachna vigintioctopunctata]|uniref:Uncharacterized protein n=1 Tax=Henosepilachna vigintioctopunctata TaxID=420089 RepID=A0AAW1UWK9_9CUCU
MKGVLAILGLVVCTTAFQYSLPQYGKLYGYHHQAYDNDGLKYGSFHGPYTNDYYQKQYAKQYPYHHDYQGDSDVYQHHYGDQEYQLGYLKSLFDKHYKNVHEKLQEHKHHEDIHEMHQHYEGEHNAEGQWKHSDKLFLKKQQDVHQLLRYINNPVYDTKFQQIHKHFNIEEHSQYYETEAFKTFIHYWNNQMFLPKGHIFSIFNDVHVDQVKVLFRMFYTAKDYETFFKTAVWARHHFNEAMFLYTYSVAIVHREDTQGLVLPPIYELYPHYFFNSEVMHKAYEHKMSHYNNKGSNENGVYTIHSNYSGWYMNINPEQSLSYYVEDIGINAYYYYVNLYFPYWMNSQDYHITHKRGEIFYYVHQQLLARYYLERLSHGVGGFDYFNWDVPFETGYYPSLTYPNGLAFNERPNFANLQEYFSNYGQHWCFISKYGYGYTYVNTYDQRIREAIDLGFYYTHDGKKVDLYTSEGFNVLGNIVQGNADTPNYRYYGSYINFARHLLGYAKQPLDNYKLAPSALEHFETSLRDPAFYKLFKKITLLLQHYKFLLPTYTKKDLYYPGVKVEKFEVSPLVTFYDKFYSDITNGLTVTPEEYQTDSFRVKVEQHRLNNKNFNYKLHVNSEKTNKAVVKVYIGPKYDEHGRVMDFYENRINFVELDQFVYTLKSGQNVIVRNSRDFTWYIRDRTSYFDLYKNVMTYSKVNDNVDSIMYGFPLRYVIPRGTEAGMTYQMYVIVFPYISHEGKVHDPMQNKNIQYQTENNKMSQYWMVQKEDHPLGFPFDRPVEFEHDYFVPNAHMKDVKIYHQIHHKDFDLEHFIEVEREHM